LALSLVKYYAKRRIKRVQYLSPDQAAKKLGISVWTVRRRIQSGEIKATKLSRKIIRIAEDDLNAYIKSNAV
jgi:excisionase family DNA binding protein